MQLSATVRQFVIFLNDKGYLNAAGMVPRHRFASFARSAIHNLEMEDLVSVKDKVYFVGPNADVQVRKFNVMRQAVQRALDGTLATAENEEGAQFFVERVIQMAERVSNLLNFAAQAAEALRVESEQDYIEQIQMIKSNSVETKHCIDAAKSKVGLTE
ncbi:MAG: hypothetical protein JKY94_01630 [Rhodobacteraceae bacterium]|nr:hypothetical protein [Paracoccaceae bacterium]